MSAPPLLAALVGSGLHPGSPKEVGWAAFHRPKTDTNGNEKQRKETNPVWSQWGEEQIKGLGTVPTSGSISEIPIRGLGLKNGQEVLVTKQSLSPSCLSAFSGFTLFCKVVSLPRAFFFPPWSFLCHSFLSTRRKLWHQSDGGWKLAIGGL